MSCECIGANLFPRFIEAIREFDIRDMDIGSSERVRKIVMREAVISSDCGVSRHTVKCVGVSIIAVDAYQNRRFAPDHKS